MYIGRTETSMRELAGALAQEELVSNLDLMKSILADDRVTDFLLIDELLAVHEILRDECENRVRKEAGAV